MFSSAVQYCKYTFINKNIIDEIKSLNINCSLKHFETYLYYEVNKLTSSYLEFKNSLYKSYVCRNTGHTGKLTF